MNKSRAPPPEAPVWGAFPFDHGGVCKTFMKGFLACMRENGGRQHRCKDEARMYLQCRMDKGLMDKDDLDELGFSQADVVVKPKHKEQRERGDLVVGLAQVRAAARKRSALFGVTNDGLGQQNRD